MTSMRCGTILIVEDEPDLRETLKDLLEYSGFEAVTAANGREGLARLAELDRPCLILLDLMMPVMDGWQFLDALQERDAQTAAPVPVVVTSAAADLSAINRAQVAQVLTKPVALEQLFELARAHCSVR